MHKLQYLLLVYRCHQFSSSSEKRLQADASVFHRRQSATLVFTYTRLVNLIFRYFSKRRKEKIHCDLLNTTQAASKVNSDYASQWNVYSFQIANKTFDCL